VKYLLDTNVVSELRREARAHPAARAWLENVDSDALHLSVLVIAELRVGVEQVARHDPTTGRRLEAWLDRVKRACRGRIYEIDRATAERWARLSVPDPLPFVDGMLAATALEHDLTLVTCNTKDVERTGVTLLNPFSSS